ncbi:hypothetical protein LSTR_LSTR017605 [Laodelphax striatellus]|uniref:Uncharacterized protein n=1 Tax=Laodelphax striatellus TaxID=195883 RepID=A0A482WPP0_LAOST|nr:hypothetical protein LSTR_LSTR017605 [Laodelphax striatellus]
MPSQPVFHPLEPEVVPTEVPPRTPSHTTVNPTTQLSPDELSPLTSRLMNDTPTDLVTLNGSKISNEPQDSQEKLGSRMDSRMEKMDNRMEGMDSRIKDQ